MTCEVAPIAPAAREVMAKHGMLIPGPWKALILVLAERVDSLSDRLALLENPNPPAEPAAWDTQTR